ncbi:dioxygenase [Skermanella aerolata]|uniref:dioxygenase family protein n=1 Tax=Skermanella aerolata TaxID=393310 RepID=UPI003D1EEE19
MDTPEIALTRDVIERFAETRDPRLKAILTSLVSHLHGFVQDIEPTPDEWNEAIGFLTRIGQACCDRRQEYLLLSDVLGVTTLIDILNHRPRKGATETTALGPFYVANAPEMPSGADIARNQPGERLHVEGSVASEDGRLLAGAIVDVWQCDGDGYYDVQYPDYKEPELRARFRTDREGRFAFWSIMPSHYPVSAGGPVGEMLAATRRHPFRPAHIHFMIEAGGHEKLVTQVFPADSPYLSSDAVFGVRTSLIAEFPQGPPGSAPEGGPEPWRRLSYDFTLKAAGRSPEAG